MRRLLAKPILLAFAGIFAGLASFSVALPQDYPARTVRVIIPARYISGVATALILGRPA